MKFRNLKTVFVLCVFPLIQQLEDVTKQEQTQPEKAKRKESVCLTVKIHFEGKWEPVVAPHRHSCSV